MLSLLAKGAVDSRLESAVGGLVSGEPPREYKRTLDASEAQNSANRVDTLSLWTPGNVRRQGAAAETTR